ncbi:hypothetical protein HZQ12_17660 [Elizabethkingia anophelis]|uniref:hypothetical protein n=1 Tax=Elizabethkingia anophelis TaxID=1117645 RepID=UPI0021A73F51|nr:hypothetical protein [Elizabethkingia anophelis]MCT3978727.1 hypothetical protein [Elizabethkingia anophelis]MCT4042858.1 hypothetical protein [Elizabethkingia anophelis]
MREPKFKKGDQVVMHSCYESELEEYKGKIWTIREDSYIDKSGQECVFLEGFSGCFLCEYLTTVKSTKV